MGKIIRDGNVISTYNYEKTVDQSDFLNMITRPANVNIVVPEGIENISDYAFSHWNFNQITLPDSVKTMGTNAFSNCSRMNITGNKLPKNLTTMGENCFSQCSSLNIQNIPKGVVAIPKYCFFTDIGLTELDLSSVKTIGYDAFYGCSKLDKVVFGEGLTTIDTEAFRNTKLTKIDMPIGYTEIKSSVFHSTPLTTAIFKGNITYIGYLSFFKCTSLSQFDLRNNTAVPILYSVDTLGHASGCKIVIPNSLYDTWTTATNWSGLTDVQWIRVINSWDDTITAEGDYVLMSDLDLTDIRHLSPSANVKGA